MDNDWSIGICYCEHAESCGWLHSCDRSTISHWWEDSVDQLGGGDVVDIDSAILSRAEDLVKIGWHIRNSRQLIRSLRRSRGVDSRIMLQRSRSPNLKSRSTACNDPSPENEDLLYWLVEIGWHGELVDLLATLEGPDTWCGGIVTSKSGVDFVFPCEGGGDIDWGLWASEEDEVEAALEIVGLEATSDGSGNLEGGLSEWDGGEWDRSRRN